MTDRLTIAALLPATLTPQTLLLSGTLLAAIGGTLLGVVRGLPAKLYQWAFKRLTFAVEVRNSDPLFHCIEIWIDQHPYATRARQVVASSIAPAGQLMAIGPSETPDRESPRVRKRAAQPLYFAPAPGDHFFRYQGKRVWLTRQREEKEMLNGIRESFTLRTLGRSQATVRALITEARDTAMPPDDPRISVLVYRWSSWRLIGRIEPRALDSVILPAGQGEALLADLERFLGSGDRYRQLGIPYRRGYLLHGLAGTGKSSLVSAVAGAVGLDVYILNVSSLEDDDALMEALADVPGYAVVLLEDIDAGTPTRAGGETKGVTFSALLNAIDGIAAREGRVLFMTTNHIDVLDPALIRPGRADLRLAFGPATTAQRAALFRRFFPAATEEMATQFAAAWRDDPPAMATLQEHLVAHWDDAHAAIAAAESRNDVRV